MAFFDPAYQGTPPWDIDGAQPAFVALAERGAITGRVLDVGCGTGENALFCAARGHETLGIDLSPRAIAKARAKADARGSAATFLLHDALDLPALGRRFDTILDSGLFHVFDDEARRRYVSGLAAALEPGGVYHMLGFSDAEPGEGLPRRLTEAELRASFAQGWTVERLERTRFKTLMHAPPGAHAWILSARRDGPTGLHAADGSDPA